MLRSTPSFSCSSSTQTPTLPPPSHTSVPNLSSQGTSSVDCGPTLRHSDSRLAGTTDSTSIDTALMRSKTCDNTNRSISVPLGLWYLQFSPRHDTNRAQYESLVHTSDAPVAFRSFPDPSRVTRHDRVLKSPALNQGRCERSSFQ